MDELQLQISRAALEALQTGEKDDPLVVQMFKKRLGPAIIALPSNPTPDQYKSIRQLIELAAFKIAAINAVSTVGFQSVIALGKGEDIATVGCTGFLVSPDIVVTAKHCVDHEDGGDYTGGAFLKELNRKPRLLKVFGSNPILHETADLALMRLAAPVSDVEIYKIAESNTIELAKNFRIVGFGKDEENNFGFDHKATVLAARFPNNGVAANKIQKFEFAIGNPTVNDGDACTGDSGGPVLAESGGRFGLAGVISRPVIDNQCGEGTICIRLDRFADWIDQKIVALGGQARPV
jgi:secreted trypsin-like serine protease